jgi:hypothetical protein
MMLFMFAFVPTGCGLISTALDMENTSVRAERANFDALEAAATQVGWRPVRGTSSTDWPLTIHVEKGEKILITENAQTGRIAFTCNGDRLDDDDRCLVEVNKIWNIAFGHILVDD